MCFFFGGGVNLKQQKSPFFLDFKPRLARVAHRHEQAQGGAWCGAPGLKLSPKKATVCWGHAAVQGRPQVAPGVTLAAIWSKTGSSDFPPEKNGWKFEDVWFGCDHIQVDGYEERLQGETGRLVEAYHGFGNRSGCLDWYPEPWHIHFDLLAPASLVHVKLYIWYYTI